MWWGIGRTRDITSWQTSLERIKVSGKNSIDAIPPSALVHEESASE